MEPVSRYATVDTANVLGNYLITVDTHRFHLTWLVNSGNKFVQSGSKKYIRGEGGGTNFREVQIKHDSSVTNRFYAQTGLTVFKLVWPNHIIM